MRRSFEKVIKKLGYKVDKLDHKALYYQLYKKYQDFTMIQGSVYCENLYVVDKFVRKIDGDVVECGVWRGGMSAGIAELLGPARSYYLFDSFEGLPPAKEIDGIGALEWQKNTNGATYFDNCTAEIGFATKAMDLTKSKYLLKKGWFNDTLPEFKTETPIALLRLDGDWYDSTMDCLKYLYPQVQKEGVIILDDYYTWDGCSRATHDYLSSITSASRVYSSPKGVCYIIKKDEYQP